MIEGRASALPLHTGETSATRTTSKYIQKTSARGIEVQRARPDGRARTRIPQAAGQVGRHAAISFFLRSKVVDTQNKFIYIVVVGALPSHTGERK
jgi:hypothetical protein